MSLCPDATCGPTVEHPRQARRPIVGWMIALGAGLLLLVTPARAVQNERDEIVRLEHAQAAAVVAADLPTLDAIYADDFRFTHGTGEVQTKTEWLDDLRTGRRVYESREVTDLDVERHGDIAVTYGRLEIRLRRDGQNQYFSARYVRVYARRDERWQLISHRTVEQQVLTPAAGR
jgi:ketosteroid isomerase-like protein